MESLSYEFAVRVLLRKGTSDSDVGVFTHVVNLVGRLAMMSRTNLLLASVVMHSAGPSYGKETPGLPLTILAKGCPSLVLSELSSPIILNSCRPTGTDGLRCWTLDGRGMPWKFPWCPCSPDP